MAAASSSSWPKRRVLANSLILFILIGLSCIVAADDVKQDDDGSPKSPSCDNPYELAGSGECSCGGKKLKGMSVKPIKGDAVLFWSMGLDGQSDINSIHGGCEVLSGEKWSATKWMRQRALSPP